MSALKSRYDIGSIMLPCRTPPLISLKSESSVSYFEVCRYLSDSMITVANRSPVVAFH